ncbi:MAG: hypothetical protein JNK82_21920 [Myxococcaceae bacterium]|nr:hypothetical protein [Myxococcaceae bacterium]
MMAIQWVDGGIAPAPLSLPPLPFTWELPPKTMHEVPIDGTTYVQGVPVRLRYVMVKDTPREIGRHFLESFKKQGLFISPGQNVERMLTGVDPQSIYTYTVVLQANGPDHTTVILGEAMPLEKKKETTTGLPLPPSAKNVLPVAFEGYTVVAFTVFDAVDDLKKFYATELPRRGYRPKSETVWVKRGEELDVKLSAVKGGSQVVIEQRATRE